MTATKNTTRTLVLVHIECETPADYRAFMQTIAIAPYIAVRATGDYLELRNAEKFKQLLKLCGGRIIEERHEEHEVVR